MPLAVRRLAPEDAEASQALGFEAFGVPTTPPTEPASLDRVGRTYYGAFDSGRLVGRLADREFASYFGGAAVSTAGIAGVTVAAEQRGQGALAPMFATMLADARERGAVISSLFPSAARIYRRLGYELVSDYATVQVPSHLLAAVPRPASVHTRRAGEADVPAIREVYDRWAQAQNGPLTRRGPSFPATDAEFLSEFTGVTLAVDGDGEICGFASWDRGQGYREDAVLEVSDLLAVTGEAYQALLATVGSFSAVTPHVKIDTSGDDLARCFLAAARWPTVASDPYMLSVLDVAGAFSARGYPPGIDVQLDFGVTGSFLPDADGTFRLTVSDGVGRCERAPGSDRTFSARGLALTYAGVQSSANLRFAGLLTGGDPRLDATWDAVLGGRQMHIRDYF